MLTALSVTRPEVCVAVGDRRSLNAAGYGSTVCINITLYADHGDRLKYNSLPVDQGCRYGA